MKRRPVRQERDTQNGDDTLASTPGAVFPVSTTGAAVVTPCAAAGAAFQLSGVC